MSDIEDRPEDVERPSPPEEADAPVERPAIPFAPSRQPFVAPEPDRTPLPPASVDDNGWPMPRPTNPGSSFGPISAEPQEATPPPPERPVRHSRNPVDRLTRGLPDPVRIAVDWIVTIAGAIAIVLIVKAFVVNPYRIPSSSMEPTLHCARSEPGCEARISDRVLANRFLYRLRDPRRGEIIVFKTPPAAQIKCGAGGTFVKRLIGLPGDTVELRLRNGNGYVYINGKPLKEPYIQQQRRARRPGLRSGQGEAGELLHDGRQPLPVVRLAHVGHGATEEPDRQGLRDLLAAEPHLAPLARRFGDPLARIA